jgi:hypothetical protein
MKKLILTVALFCSTALNAQVKYLDGFEKTKYGYIKTVFTEEEAIKLYSYIMDKNGVDTLQSNFSRGKNPVALGYFKVDSTSKKVNVGVIVSYSGVYDVLFTTIKDQDTVLFTVEDENGELIDLFYRKPEK